MQTTATAAEVGGIDTILAFYRVQADVNTRLSDVGVTTPQAACLAALANGPLTMGELGFVMLHANSTITDLADRLEKRGCIRRQRSAEDRRIITLHITEDGRNVLAKARVAFAKATG